VALSSSESRVGVSPWVVAAIVVIPTFMEVLDTTITVVALRYIAGGLSATVNDGEWVITSYLAANAIILPITGWLSAHLGRRNYFLLSMGVFTLASGLCGMATSLGQHFVAENCDRGSGSMASDHGRRRLHPTRCSRPEYRRPAWRLYWKLRPASA